MVKDFKTIRIIKNRGWRGLAEAIVLDEDRHQQLSMIFSFSQPVWDDLVLLNKIVIQDSDYFYVIKINEKDREKLPKANQQRSVLIKNFMGEIVEVNRYEKATWKSAAPSDFSSILHFLRNRNNHTTSDWNCIGIRVKPEI